MSEKIFEYDLDMTGAIDYGASMEGIFGGKEAVPLQGTQFDITLEGKVAGRVAGSMRGIDYLHVRADGRRQLCLRGTIETEDGSRIAFIAQGVGTPRAAEPIVDLAVRIDMLTGSPTYGWTNAQPAWGAGYANLETGRIHIDAYLH